MALIDDFKARFPAATYPQFPDAVVDVLVPILEPEIECYYGGDYANCDAVIILYLMAHLIVVETQAGSGNSEPSQTEVSKTVGSVSVSYLQKTGTVSERDQFFGSTLFGRRYLVLTAKNYGPRVA